MSLTFEKKKLNLTSVPEIWGKCLTVQEMINNNLTNGERVGLKGRGFLGGLGLCGVGGALEWATEC